MNIPSFLLVPVVAAIALAGCSSGPAQKSADAPASVTQQLARDNEVPLTGENVVALQHLGYRIVNKNGQKLYCSIQPKTGSHIQQESVCLTEKELVALREQTQRNLQNVTMQLAPPQGK